MRRLRTSAPRFFVPPGLSKGTLPEVNAFLALFRRAFRLQGDQTCMSFLVTRDLVGPLERTSPSRQCLFTWRCSGAFKFARGPTRVLPLDAQNLHLKDIWGISDLDKPSCSRHHVGAFPKTGGRDLNSKLLQTVTWGPPKKAKPGNAKPKPHTFYFLPS